MANYDYDAIKQKLGIADNSITTKFVPDLPPVPVSVDPAATGIPAPEARVPETDNDLIKKIGYTKYTELSPEDKKEYNTYIENNPTDPMLKGRSIDFIKEANAVKTPEYQAAKMEFEKQSGNAPLGLTAAQTNQSVGMPTAQEKQAFDVAEIEKANQFGGSAGVNPNELATGESVASGLVNSNFGGGYDLAVQGYRELGAEQTKAYQQMADERQKMQAMLEQQQKDKQARVDKYNADMNKAYEEYKSKNVSMDNFWAERATGSKLLAGIGIILGGIGQMQGQKTNTGLDIIMKAIDQDLVIQRSNLEKAGREMDYKRGILSDMMKQSDDIDEGMIKAKMLVFQNIEDKLKAASANPQAKVMIGQLQAQKDILGIKLQNLASKATSGQVGIETVTAQADKTFKELNKLYQGNMLERIGKETPIVMRDRNEKVDALNAQLEAMATSVLGRFGAKAVKAYRFDARDTAQERAWKQKRYNETLAAGHIYKKNKGISGATDDIEDIIGEKE